MKKTNRQILILIVGILFLTTYVFQDLLIIKFPITTFLLFISTGLVFIISFIQSIFNRDRLGVCLGLVVLPIIFVYELKDSEIFKEEIILEASLIDDLSGIHLTLRKGNNFEMVSSSLFGEEKFNGTYTLKNDIIILHDRPFDNDFIPDTLTIIGDKLIYEFDNDGNPKADFASYFTIWTKRLETL